MPGIKSSRETLCFSLPVWKVKFWCVVAGKISQAKHFTGTEKERRRSRKMWKVAMTYLWRKGKHTRGSHRCTHMHLTMHLWSWHNHSLIRNMQPSVWQTQVARRGSGSEYPIYSWQLSTWAIQGRQLKDLFHFPLRWPLRGSCVTFKRNQLINTHLPDQSITTAPS